MKKILLIIIGLSIVTYGWYRFELRPVDSSSAQRVKIEIPKGASVDRIGQILSEKNVLRSPAAFSYYVRFHGASTGLQAGTFIFSPSMAAAEIVDVLQSGKSEEVAITIPEGLSVRGIDALLAEKGIAASGAILHDAMSANFDSFAFLPKNVTGLAARGGQLEGYLFPETYYVSTTDFVPKFFLERMLGTFRKKVVDPYASDIAASKHSLRDIMIVASLVEAETRTDNERPLVAGIIWKRLKEKTILGIDATVRYVVDRPTSEELTLTDLASDSPYNTRRFRGLPPGPITNPGLASILAAIKPVDSPYWYYLHDRKGVIHYAVTNEEHNLNRKKYLGG